MSNQPPTWPNWQWPTETQPAQVGPMPPAAAPQQTGGEHQPVGPMDRGMAQQAPAAAQQGGATAPQPEQGAGAGATGGTAQPQQPLQGAGMGRGGGSPMGGSVASAMGPGLPMMPLVDVVETPDDVVVLVDMPGFEEQDITVQADDDSLIVTGERPDEMEDEGDTRVHVRERSPHVQRRVELPVATTIEEARATHENGVCRVTLPKAEETDRRTIAFQ